MDLPQKMLAAAIGLFTVGAVVLAALSDNDALLVVTAVTLLIVGVLLAGIQTAMIWLTARSQAGTPSRAEARQVRKLARELLDQATAASAGTSSSFPELDEPSDAGTVTRDDAGRFAALSEIPDPEPPASASDSAPALTPSDDPDDPFSAP